MQRYRVQVFTRDGTRYIFATPGQAHVVIAGQLEPLVSHS